MSDSLELEKSRIQTSITEIYAVRAISEQILSIIRDGHNTVYIENGKLSGINSVGSKPIFSITEEERSSATTSQGLLNISVEDVITLVNILLSVGADAKECDTLIGAPMIGIPKPDTPLACPFQGVLDMHEAIREAHKIDDNPLIGRQFPRQIS